MTVTLIASIRTRSLSICSSSSGARRILLLQQQQHRTFFGGRGHTNGSKKYQRSSSSWFSSRSASTIPGPAGLPSRSDHLAKLQQSDTTNASEETNESPVFDVLIIGGGATGCGIALDAARRGLSVACIERGDFASETSSRSTKLVWAGIRYLATATAALLRQPLDRWMSDPSGIVHDFFSELHMVQQCHTERRFMLERQGHLVHWMPIAVPFTSYLWDSPKHGEQQPPPFGNRLFQLFPLVAPVVFKVYDGLSSFSCPPSYPASVATTQELVPTLRCQSDSWSLAYAHIFYEAMHNDARTNLAIALSAAAHGATMCNYVQAESLVYGPSTSDTAEQRQNVVQGAVVKNVLTGDSWTVRAKRVVVAAGPFTDAVRASGGGGDITPAVRGGAGTHIVLGPHVLSTQNCGVLEYNTSDGRFMFVLPWLGHTLVGTTDAPCDAQTRHDPPEREIDWLLEELQTVLDIPGLQRSDVLSAWRGWRPLAVDPHAPPGAAVSRDHVISEDPSTQLLFIAGGKWTTWREMAEQVVDRLTDKTCTTLDVVLHGGEGAFTPMSTENQQMQSPTELVEKYGVAHDIADHLVATYGTRAHEVLDISLPDRLVDGFPYIEAEVVYACHEYACTVEDILSRRTRLAFLNVEAAQKALPRVTQLMAQQLGWSKRMQQQQRLDAESFLGSFGGPDPR